MYSGCDFPYKSCLCTFWHFIRYHSNGVVCHDKFGPPPFLFPQSTYFETFGPPALILWTPMHVINYSRDLEGSGWVLGNG